MQIPFLFNLEPNYKSTYGHEIITPFAFNGSMNGDLFEGWLEHILVPEFKKSPKRILVADNASWHKKDAIFDIADKYGSRVIFLPSYFQI